MDLSLLESKFSSFKELEEAIKIFSRENFVHLYIRDARKLSPSANYRKLISSVNESLVYYSIKYCCVNGGRRFIKYKTSKNERKTKTKKAGCNFFVCFLLSRDGKHLELTKANNSHNHILNEELYKMHPLARKLPETIKKEVGELMKLGVNKKLLQAKLIKETGKTVLVKDLLNIAAKCKDSSRIIDEVVEKLENEYNCSVCILKKNNCLKGIYFQDKKMENAYKYYPEVLFIDGTYELTDIGFVCFTFLIEDGNGNSEIVGIGLLAQEDTPSIKWLIEAFQNRNITFPQTRAIMADKDLVKREILKDKFPCAKLLICVSQVLRSIECEITTDKMKITNEEAIIAKDLLTKLCYASTEEEYLDWCESFLNSVPISVIDYYNKTWHPIYTEWTRISSKYGNFLNFTNNRVESFNTRLKSTIKPYSSLSAFVENFFTFLHTLRMEKNIDAFNCTLMLPSDRMKENDPAYPFEKELLSYPLEFVKKQIDASYAVILKEVYSNNFTYTYNGHDYPVNCNFCCCIKFNAMRLPCKHIFSVRKKMGMPFYDADLVDQRWTKNYMTGYERMLVENESEHEELILPEEPKGEKVKSKDEKFSILSDLASEIAVVGSESSGKEFDRKKKLLEDILRCWKNNISIDLSAVSNHTSNSGSDANHGDHDNAPRNILHNSNRTYAKGVSISSLSQGSNANHGNHDNAPRNILHNSIRTYAKGVSIFSLSQGSDANHGDHDNAPRNIQHNSILKGAKGVSIFSLSQASHANHGDHDYAPRNILNNSILTGAKGVSIFSLSQDFQEIIDNPQNVPDVSITSTSQDGQNASDLWNDPDISLPLSTLGEHRHSLDISFPTIVQKMGRAKKKVLRKQLLE